jgi:Niemann-Pick C1 protein
VQKPRTELVRTLFEKQFVPLIFNKLSQVVIFAIAGCLFIISVMACIKLKLGLNQNVGFVNGSDLYNYFETLFDYGGAGPPGYLVFNNVDYTL